MEVHIVMAENDTIVGVFADKVRALECCVRYEELDKYMSYRVETHTVLGFEAEE